MSDLNTIVEKMIFIIRGTKVMLDNDLAALYGVETKALNKAVKRNLERFPEDFMFQLNYEELADLRFQIGTAKLNHKRRSLPYVFTENGVAMLSGILHSERAISVNISIMRTFTKIRNLNSSEKNKTSELFEIVFDRLDEVDLSISKLKRELPTLSPKRRRIGIKK